MLLSGQTRLETTDVLLQDSCKLMLRICAGECADVCTGTAMALHVCGWLVL
jgi:hypothetical protein